MRSKSRVIITLWQCTGHLVVLPVMLQAGTWNVSVRITVCLSDIPTKNVRGFLHYFLFAVTIITLNTPLRLPSKLLGQSPNYSRP